MDDAEDFNFLNQIDNAIRMNEILPGYPPAGTPSLLRNPATPVQCSGAHRFCTSDYQSASSRRSLSRLSTHFLCSAFPIIIKT